MLGAIIGDIVGSVYEYANVYRRSEVIPFKISLRGVPKFTDDSVLTMAVASALTKQQNLCSEEALRQEVAKELIAYYKKYPLKRAMGNNSYGSGFVKWAETGDINCKGTSWANGAAMRVAPVGWMYSTIEETIRVAEITAISTHNHEKAINAAQAIAAAIYLARHTKNKDTIKTFIEKRFGYRLSNRVSDVSRYKKESREYRRKNLLKGNLIDCDSETSIEKAFLSFFIADSFEDCIKTAISLGGDSDTIACMAGAIAEAYYGIPISWKKEAFLILEHQGCKEEDLKLISEFRKKYAAQFNENWKSELENHKGD